MANPFLIIVTVILSLAIIAGCIYVLVYFQHPEDKNVAWGPKIVVVLGLSLACFSVLMLPLDVGNANSHGGFPMATLWLVIYIIMAVFAVVIVPFAMFYYEGDEYDETGKADSQLIYALKGTFITVIVFAIITVVMYLFLGIAEIPVIQLTGPFITTQNRTVPFNEVNQTLFNYSAGSQAEKCSEGNITDTANCTDPNFPYPYNLDNETGWCTPILNVTLNVTRNETIFNETTGLNHTIYFNETTWVLQNSTCLYYDPFYIPQDQYIHYGISRAKTHAKFRMSIALYIITMIVFFGWILFIIFGGIGMVAFPLDCIAAWRRRPVRITLEKFVTRKKEIGEQATKLIAKGKAIQEKQRKGKENKRDRRNYNKFRQAVFILEEDYERLQECYKRQGGKVILYFLTLILGIISVGLTIVWLLHIILYVFTQPYPIDPFLNTMVEKMDSAWGFLGTIAYGVFSYYLLLCCIKGNFKFGMRVFFLFPIHPMRVGGTLMNAFLFNTGLILICAFSVTQFCTTAFSDYTSKTAINSMFALAVKDAMGIKYIFIGYVYALFIMVFLTGIYFVLKPKDKPAIDDIRV